VKSFN